MNDGSLTTLLAQYRSGLEAQMVLLRRLQIASAKQRDAAAAQDFELLHLASDERDSLMAGLVTIENQIREVRATLKKRRKDAQALPGYREAVELHSQALRLTQDILRTDDEATEALQQAEQIRRAAAKAVEQGETTLTAYRRVMSAPAGAKLVDRRG
jgi:hypothetical protein